PGLYPDEAFDVIPAMQILLGHPVELQRNVGLHLFGLDLPLMSSSDYQGVTSTYLALPFFAIFGINVVSLRLMTVAVGLLGVILTFFLARKWFGPNVARLSVILIATSPAWVFWSRLGVYVVSQVMPIAAGSLICFTNWARKRPIGKRNASLYWGIFLLGLGLTTKLLFLWFIVDVPLTAVVLYGRQIWDTRRAWLSQRTQWLRTAFFAFLAFCAGASPFILYNLLSGGTFNLIRSTLSASGGTSNGVDNSAILRNLWTRADNFRVLLDGSYFWFQTTTSDLFHPETSYANPLTPAFFVLSALGLIVLILLDRPTESTSLARPQPLRIGTGLIGIALLIAFVLSLGVLSGTTAAILVLATTLLAIAGVFLVVRLSLVYERALHASAWLLLASTSIAGVIWWIGGAGRPETKAPGALLGLWPIDAAGALFWISGAGLVLLLGWDRTPVPGQRVATAALAILGLVLGESAVTVSGLWSTHLIVILPLPQMVIADFAISLAQRVAARLPNLWQGWAKRAAYALPLLAIVGSIAFSDLRVSAKYQRDMAITGGSATFSDSIYTLATYLDTQNPRHKVVSLDWGMKRTIQFLTLDRVNPLDAYGYEATPSEATKQALTTLITEPGNLYLFHTPEAGIAYPRFNLFKQLAANNGKHPTLERTFYTRNGIPVYQVYSLAPGPIP
ncbi:MAG: glycosyltransferase family 39 protein, partial [Chloroflexia bacterium]